MPIVETLKDKIVDSVIQGIIDGVYAADEVITEKRLIEAFDVSKSPVRDALMELCANRVLKSIPRYGYQVVQISPEDISDMMEYRFFLEAACVRKSVNSVTQESIAELERLEYQVQQDIRNNPDYPVTAHWNNNMLFHLLLASLANNRYLCSELKKTMAIQKRGYAQYYQLHKNEEPTIFSVTCHTFIVDALKRKNVDDAIEGLRQDIGKINLVVSKLAF